MSDTNCPRRQTFVIGTPPTYGSPNPRYIKPLVRINGMMQDVPFGYTLNPCILPMAAIAAATNQTLSTAGNVVTLSGGGGSITLPVDKDEQTLSLVDGKLTISNGNTVTLPTSVFALTSEPEVTNGVLGTSEYLLGKPPAFIQVTIAGVLYKIPAYSSDTTGNG